MFSLWADSPEEADAWAAEVRNAGGTILTEPAGFGNNWYGFEFADPDGHKWNVFHM
jgi:predicted lactoylglutathione lyase